MKGHIHREVGLSLMRNDRTAMKDQRHRSGSVKRRRISHTSDEGSHSHRSGSTLMRKIFHTAMKGHTPTEVGLPDEEDLPHKG
jgi:hypothetical protein